MRKVLSVYTVIALLSLLMVSQAISIVSANPWFMSKQIDPPSGAIPPIISINNPKNNAIYSGTFNISFSVKKAQYSNYFSDIFDVTYIIDNESVTIPHNGDVLAISQYTTSFVVPTLANGNHSLTAKARGIVYELFSVFFYMDSSSQVYFVTSDNSTQTNPPNETINEGSASNNPATSGVSNTKLVVAIVSSIVIVAVASLSLVYFKKHKKNKLTNKQSFL